jgi:tetratricopeptide (TPR) repeat protein
MRKVFERVTERLRAFLAQRDDLALVVRCTAADGMAILQLLQTLEEESTSEMFWMFPEAFTTPAAYTSAVVAAFASKHGLVRLLQEKEGTSPWPTLPASVQDENLPPEQRLRELMVFARSLLPVPEGALLVWVMFPGEVGDRPAYARLMREVLRHEFPFPWCHHMRVLLRDDPADPVLHRNLREAPRIAWYEPDLSPRAMEKAMDEEVENESLPLGDRLQALLLTAGLDYSHQRYALALEKYQLIFQYHAHAGNNLLTAVALNGMGETHRATGNKAEASACFEAAMVPATDGPSPSVPLMMNVALNLGSLRMEEKRWAEAEGYYDSVQKLATVQRETEVKIQALEQLGLAQYQQGKVPAALETWNAGATLADKLEQPALRKSILERLRDHYARSRDQVKQREVEQQLAALARPATN